MSGAIDGARRTWTAVMAGLVWAQACVALELIALPRNLAPGDGIASGWPYRLARLILLAPLSWAGHLAAAVARPEGAAPVPAVSLTVLVMCSLLGVGLCASVAWVLGVPGWRRTGVAFLAGAATLGVVSAGIVGMQVRNAAVAERVFFAMVSRVDDAHEDAATVSGARDFARAHPTSRWTGEALRIVAMAEWDAGRFEEASQVWAEFGRRFRDRSAPGVAYAEYSMALCEQRIGRTAVARGHLRAAIEVIRARDDGIQGWIATAAARQLSACERSEGRYALAEYWKTKSGTFADVHVTE